MKIDCLALKNIDKLNSIEKKNLSILIIARTELGRLFKEDHDESSLKIFRQLSSIVPDYSKINELFDNFQDKNHFNKTKLLKKIRKIEEVGVYLSDSAIIYNKFLKTTDIAIKGFAYNLMLDWFVGEKADTKLFGPVANIDFQGEIDKLIQRTRGKKEERKSLNKAFENSIEISEFLSKYQYQAILPRKIA